MENEIKESFNKYLSKLKDSGIDTYENSDINVTGNNDGDYIVTSAIFCKSDNEIELEDKINSLTKTFSYPSFTTFWFPAVISKQKFDKHFLISTTLILVSNKHLHKIVEECKDKND